MTVDQAKSTFTAEEAAELERLGYEMIEVATLNSPTYWIIGFWPSPAANKENKEPSW